tara:strand:- start:81 stop:290 length:210 start_codon:yes stop_codon:yes gene_type:complete
MKKSDREINLFERSQNKFRNARSDSIKTTDVNILLNRVRMTKKSELKKRILFLTLLLLGVILVGVFTFI